MGSQSRPVGNDDAVIEAGVASMPVRYVQDTRRIIQTIVLLTL